MIYPYEIVAALLRILDHLRPLWALFAAWAIISALIAIL